MALTPCTSEWHRLRRVLGPRQSRGAADDDPSANVTYTQTGAQFACSQFAIALFRLPLMMAIPEAGTRIGAATGRASRSCQCPT